MPRLDAGDHLTPDDVPVCVSVVLRGPASPHAADHELELRRLPMPVRGCETPRPRSVRTVSARAAPGGRGTAQRAAGTLSGLPAGAGRPPGAGNGGTPLDLVTAGRGRAVAAPRKRPASAQPDGRLSASRRAG